MTTALAPTYEVAEIDPHSAKELLNRNDKNRNLRDSLAESYASDMAAGNWRENGESIKVATDGTLIDGQHRLQAVVLSGTTQRMLVVRDLPADVQSTVDGGARRTFADALRMREVTNYNRVAAVCRRVNHWQRGERRQLRAPRRPATTTELLATWSEHPEIRASADVADMVRRAIPMHASVLGLCHWLFHRIDAEDCDEFFDRLVDGANLDADNPIAVLRRTVIERMSGRGKSNYPEHVITAYTVKAWNAYRSGRSISHLRFRPGGKSPEEFPEPV